MTQTNSVLKRNNVQVKGNGDQVIVFAHGFGCDQNSWKFIEGAFTDNYKVVLFDYVGAGNSDLTAYDSEKYSTLNGYAQDVIDVCNALNVKDGIFVGHSVSTMIGILAAIKEPGIFSKMVLIGPSPRYLNDADYIGGFERSDLESLLETMDDNYLGWSGTMAPAIMANRDRPELGQFLTNSFCSMDPDIARRFARTTFFSDNRSDLKDLTVKSLTLQCREDIIAPFVVGEYIKHNTPHNSMYLMNATGHCPHISEPDETIRVIKEFINQKTSKVP